MKGTVRTMDAKVQDFVEARLPDRRRHGACPWRKGRGALSARLSGDDERPRKHRFAAEVARAVSGMSTPMIRRR
jgi:hypothetical protein